MQIFFKFSDIAVEDFKIQIQEIQSEIAEIMKYGKFKEFNKIKMLNDWFVEQERLLDQYVLHPINQQCQEMHDLLARHADKSRFFDTRSPEQFRALLKKISDNHRCSISVEDIYLRTAGSSPGRQARGNGCQRTVISVPVTSSRAPPTVPPPSCAATASASSSASPPWAPCRPRPRCSAR